MKTITRRHFMISGRAALGACLIPARLLRRLRDFQLDNDDDELLIEGPDYPKRTLWATDQGGSWQLALDYPTREFPTAVTWRNWLSDHEKINPKNRRDLAEWLRENQHLVETESGALDEEWLDRDVSNDLWMSYLGGTFATTESSEARALSYLERLKIAQGPLRNSHDTTLGRLDYYHGTDTRGNWHFANCQGALILPALQHRLLQLGEETSIKIAG
ncbi:MAG: hypothetical protein RL077_2156 [Verrucomicrobiota bacterium]|jgi:hypothetical protein